MAVRKKTKVFFLTPTKKIKLRLACGLEKDVPGSGKREAGSELLGSAPSSELQALLSPYKSAAAAGERVHH